MMEVAFPLPSERANKKPERPALARPRVERPRRAAKETPMAKALLTAMALHAGAYSAVAYKPEAIREMTHLVEKFKDYAVRGEKIASRDLAHGQRLKLAVATEMKERGQRNMGEFILAAEAIDERADGRVTDTDVPRQEYQRLLVELRARLGERHTQEIEPLLQALHDTLQRQRRDETQHTTITEPKFDYQGLGGLEMSALLRDHSGSCAQIGLLMDSLAHDAGYEGVGLRIYPPDAHGVTHHAPVIDTSYHGRPITIDLTTGHEAAPTDVQIPFESLITRYVAPHGRYLDVMANDPELARQPFSIQSFDYPSGHGLPFPAPGGVPFFSSGISHIDLENIGAAASEAAVDHQQPEHVDATNSHDTFTYAEAQEVYTITERVLQASQQDIEVRYPLRSVVVNRLPENLILMDMAPLPAEQRPTAETQPAATSPVFSDVSRRQMDEYAHDIERLNDLRQQAASFNNVEIKIDLSLMHLWRMMRDGSHGRDRAAAQLLAETQLAAVRARIVPALQRMADRSPETWGHNNEMLSLMSDLWPLLDDPGTAPIMRQIIRRGHEHLNFHAVWLRIPALQDVARDVLEQESADMQLDDMSEFSDEELAALSGNAPVSDLAREILGLRRYAHAAEAELRARDQAEDGSDDDESIIHHRISAAVMRSRPIPAALSQAFAQAGISATRLEAEYRQLLLNVLEDEDDDDNDSAANNHAAEQTGFAATNY